MMPGEFFETLRAFFETLRAFFETQRHRGTEKRTLGFRAEAP
jgi:hypothetical protein